MTTQWLVMAKAPVPGTVKTRLCPPYTPVQAAQLAAAALADTLTVIGADHTATRTLVLSGQYAAPHGWRVVPQRGEGLASRLVHAFQDTQRPGTASVLVGMDTPQLTRTLLESAVATLHDGSVDAVLGPAEDGGWWALGLRHPAQSDVLQDVPMSTPHTGVDTLAALRHRGMLVALLPTLRDVDTAGDAHAVAHRCGPRSRFRRLVTVELAGTVTP